MPRPSPYYQLRAGKRYQARSWLQWAVAGWTDAPGAVWADGRPWNARGPGGISPVGGTNASPPALHAPAGRWGDDSEANHRWLREDLGLESIIPPVTGRLSRGMTTRPYRRRLQLAFPRKVYDQRWRVETLISVVKRRFGGAVTDRRYWQQVKQTLLRGIAYNLYRAAVIHLHLVCFAFALLTHLRLEQTGAQGQRKRDNAANWPTTTAQDQLQRLVWDDLMASLKENHHDEFIVAELT